MLNLAKEPDKKYTAKAKAKECNPSKNIHEGPQERLRAKLAVQRALWQGVGWISGMTMNVASITDAAISQGLTAPV